MKKLLIPILLLLLISCGKDDETLHITDFTESRSVTLEPYENIPYAMMNIWVKGYVNDTVLVKLQKKDSEPILKLSGNIDVRWYTDYYGGMNQTVIFEPYKATKGNLELKMQL